MREETWRTPECPFRIEWSGAVLDEIRLAATEALFSLPHGGAEIGGVLFGSRSAGLVRILAARPLECEYASGPSFTLSAKDHARFRTLLEEGCQDLQAQRIYPVGWYHSHTRSEVMLSARDVEIHNRYFPDPWHVALVVRPHAMQPMRAGFFFREADDSIQANTSGTVADYEKRWSAPPWFWWPALVSAVALPAGTGLAVKPRTSISLTAFDVDGQVQVHWDLNAAPIRLALSGTLEIADGAVCTKVARVDLHLIVVEPGGGKHEEFTRAGKRYWRRRVRSGLGIMQS